MNEQIISALKAVIAAYGIEHAKVVEQVFRNETTHFASKNFYKTLSPGMEAFSQTFPYGYHSAEKLWIDKKQYAPVGVFDEKENNSALCNSRGIRHFVKFADIEASMMSCAEILHSRGGDGGSWFSIADKQLRNKYNEYISHIIPRFCNSISTNQ